eukprot:m.490335 g.490335  ORF g.490335 m.490335 type:complete len:307 (+) comp27832_c0_seq1:257-1177(+)
MAGANFLRAGFFGLVAVMVGAIVLAGVRFGLTHPEATYPSPMFFVHVPKTGSTMVNLLVAHGCPGLPYGQWNEPDTFKMTFWLSYYVLGRCHGAFARFEGAHAGVSEQAWRQYAGHMVGMFREVVPRLVSGWLHNFHDCPAIQRRYHGCDTHDNHTCAEVLREPPDKALVQEYAACVRGCAVKMLNGLECRYSTFRPVSSQDVGRAVDHVLYDFAFVGLTAEFDASVKQWNGLFGTGFDQSRLRNTRPGVKPPGNLRNTLTALFEAAVRDKPDPDAAVFRAAQTVFRRQQDRLSKRSSHPHTATVE